MVPPIRKGQPKPGAKPAPTSTVVKTSTLPTKEAALFRQVLQQYEAKEWKKGIKTAETILKTYPDHGETLAMKGLFLSCIDRKPEGYEFVKRGVRMDIGSHIVWHVYGIMHRADKNFEEALKCYSQANRLEKDSPNIIGDLALLTIHLRKYPAYVEARLSILRTGPRLRRNWIALAVAQHLNSQYFESDRTLTHYETMLREMPEKEYEHSEVLLYHALVLEEGGEYEKCLEFLGENAGNIVDRLAYSVQRAHLLLKLGRTEPAEWAWELLLEENPDNYEYIKAYVQAKGANVDSTTEEGKVAAAKVLEILAEKYPRSLAVRRIALELVSGEEFRTKVSNYLINALSKGVPSIFADIKSLYKDSNKRNIIGELAESYRKSLESSYTFGVPINDESDDATVESSSSYLWTLYFLSQHYSALSQHSKALSILALAEAHTPSLPELSMLKARILKRAGDPIGALEAMKDARELDGQDRFLNSKMAKYLIRAEEIEEAEGMVGLFTKKDAPSPLADLVEMQCLWFLHEQGDSYLRQEKFALALKRFHQIFDIFTEVEEDQYDFHGYCLRKSTLRAYINLLRYIDTLRNHPRYIAAAKGAIGVYLNLHDDPTSILPTPLTNGAAEAALLKEEEAKKKVEEAAKAKKLTEKVVVDKGKKSANKKVEEEEVPVVIVDLDPLGELLLQTKEPLVQALKFLKPLQKAAPGVIDTWLLSFEVAIRREKYLQALKALRTAHSIDSSSPALHTLVIKFIHLIQSLPSDFSPSVLSTLQSTLPELTRGLTSSVLGSEFLQSHSGVPEVILAVAKGMLVDCGEDKSEVEGLLFELNREETTPSLNCLVEGLSLLKSWKSQRTEEFREGAKNRYPIARALKNEEELKLMEKKVEVVLDENKELIE